MSLRYLYNKLNDMSSLEQECYIKNTFKQFDIKPKFDIDNLFTDKAGKQAKNKNPLGYLVMHLSYYQIQHLVPEYFRDLCCGFTFGSKDDKILSIIDRAMNLVELEINEELYRDIDVDQSDVLSVFEFGVGKYSPYSFLKLDPYELIPALFRHLYKHYYISTTDEETGLPHMAHAFCNLRMIEMIVKRR